MRKRTTTRRDSSVRQRLGVALRHDDLIAGVDLHRDVLQLELQRPDGAVLFNGAFSTQREARSLLAALQGKVARMACEATGFWYWFADLCAEHRIPLTLGNPKRLRMIADSVKKCDRLDAHWICEFLRQGYLDEVSMPDRESRDQRELIRVREQIKKTVQDFKRRVRSFLMQYGITTRSKNPFSPRGIDELRSLPLRADPKQALMHLLNALGPLDAELALIDEEVGRVATENVMAHALQHEVKGVGPILASTIALEAMNIQRFASDRKFACYTGLVPKVRESAGKQTRGGMTKQGPRHLRWALVQAARTMVAHDEVVKKWFVRHRRRKGACRSYVMVAHKLARYVWMLAVHGLVYEPKLLFPPARRRVKAA